MINKHLENIRTHEINIVYSLIKEKKGALLEIGAGAGWQAKWLSEKGYAVSAIDLQRSKYNPHAIWPITLYDGIHIPFPNNTFDVIFSSNCLEHIRDLDAFQKEMQRVLKKDGLAIHVLPSSTWRLWTNLTHYLRIFKRYITESRTPKLKDFKIKRHGERGTLLTESYYFNYRWWLATFKKNGWNILKCLPNNLFYTGPCLLDSKLPLETRKKLSSFLGSACFIFLMKKAN